MNPRAPFVRLLSPSLTATWGTCLLLLLLPCGLFAAEGRGEASPSKGRPNQASRAAGEDDVAAVAQTTVGDTTVGDTTSDNTTSDNKTSDNKTSDDSGLSPGLPPLERASAGTAWLLFASALVFLLVIPGLAFFYAGLVRRKNVLSVLMQCLFLMAVMTLAWGLWGYSLAFSGSSRWIGGVELTFFRGLGASYDIERQANVTPLLVQEQFGRRIAVPRLGHSLFHGMLFVLTPALICGAFAERMRFAAVVSFGVAWGTLVYCPLCHWVWHPAGWLHWGAEGSLAGGSLDFAGGTVVHLSSGIAALVCALLIGRRFGAGVEPMPPHNLTYTALGAALMWCGWFGFNTGSRLIADEVTFGAMAATHIAGASGALAWVTWEWLARRRPSLLGGCSGAIAGLVCITPACGYVQPGAACLIGLAGGFSCCWACTRLKNRWGYDDTLDVFGIHGVGGAVGAVLTGVFATRSCLGSGSGPLPRLGVIDGNWQTLLAQLSAIAVAFLYTALMTFALLKLIDLTIGLRVSRDAEQDGLDITEHGEEGYLYLKM